MQLLNTTKQLRKAKKEYEKARDIVEDIVLSFNRELKREAEQIETVSLQSRRAQLSQAEAGLRKAENFEKRVTPLETKINQVNQRS